MGSLSSFSYMLPLFLLHLYLQVSAAHSNVSFSLKSFGKNSDFTSHIFLYGDAKVAEDGMSVKVSGSGVSSGGRIVLKKPINLVEVNSRKKVSFSMYFVFSLTGGNGDGLAFIMVPVGFPLDAFNGGSMGMFGDTKTPFIAIEFDTYKDEKYGDVNGNHVGIDFGSLVSVKVSNVSLINLELNSGEMLQSWIDYEASSNRFEVRLSKLGDVRPVRPLLVYPIDLSKLWRDKEIALGLTSSNGNSSQVCTVYSMRFKSRIVPIWMHSEPVNPEDFLGKGNEVRVPRKSDCALKIVGALILGTGFGALVALMILFTQAIFKNKRPVVPEEYAIQSKEFEYKKFSADVDKTTQNAIK